MKKNLKQNKVLISAIACGMLMTSTVMAEGILTAEDNGVLLTQENEISVQEGELSVGHHTNPEARNDYVVQEGKITEIRKNANGNVSVTISGNTGLIAHLQPGTYVINVDEPSLDTMSVEDLQVGMEISFVIPANSPMAMSYPAQTSSVVAVVVHGEVGSFKISTFDEDLLSQGRMLKLNIGENTQIIQLNDITKTMTEDAIKNSQSMVFYSVTTRSIPAQTTPSLVLILGTDTVSEEEPVSSDVELVALRAHSEALGYHVEWISNTEPIILTKEDTTIELTIGATSYKVNDEERTLSAAVELNEDITFVSTEIFE